MKLAIMQPYLFPYLGYFQLMAACDVFVLYDDVQYIKGGWINRNRVPIDGRACWITLPVEHAPHRLPIAARYYVDDRRARRCLLNQMRHAYARAPAFNRVYALLADLMRYEERNVARFNENALRRLAAYLSLKCEIVNASVLSLSADLRGEARVLTICARMGASRYINPLGGASLYLADAFGERGVELYFLHPPERELVAQNGVTGSGHMSIIDLLMYNDADQMSALLNQYRLSRAQSLQAA